MDTIFVCPVCHLPLLRQTARYVCRNSHAFDIAREGYVNLLLANQKRSREPGDDSAMVRNRRAFLGGGYYDRLRDKLIEIFAAYMDIADTRYLSVLDVGCGEGFYSGSLQDCYDLQPLRFYGIDISKFAVKVAARRYRSVDFAVASTHHLPVHDERVDFLLNVFAPRSFPEFSRVLGPCGKLIVITPGPMHLWELKQMIYTEARPHTLDETVPAGFALQYNTELRYQILLEGQAVIDQLLSMTPYNWRTPESKRQSILQRERLETTVEFELRVYEKRDS